ncbi:uncharacterized protein DS421_14g461460 [Arachis hypogaea]|nr:uncharacterized protein DS421_14g461460 [Arachis hypogaea]
MSPPIKHHEEQRVRSMSEKGWRLDFVAVLLYYYLYRTLLKLLEPLSSLLERAGAHRRKREARAGTILAGKNLQLLLLLPCSALFCPLFNGYSWCLSVCQSCCYRFRVSINAVVSTFSIHSSDGWSCCGMGPLEGCCCCRNHHRDYRYMVQSLLPICELLGLLRKWLGAEVVVAGDFRLREEVLVMHLGSGFDKSR